jgi:peroxiredoxin Q/BCP
MSQIIPDFEVAASGNQRFSSAAFKGHPYVLYFYPKDDTPGCTIEGTQFRDLHQEFKCWLHDLRRLARQRGKP